jgi:hypothetical protein
VLGLTALPCVSHAQSPVVTRGAFRGPQSGDATTGVLRGPLPSGATVCAGRGAVPADATIGAVRSGSQSGETIGTFRGATAPLDVGTFRGAVPADATVGTFATPAPAGARFGGTDIARRLTDEARMSLRDHDFARGEALLNRSITIREESVGRDHPDVAKALEDNATLLRQYNRGAAAADMDARAREIRTLLEAPPKPAQRAEGAPPQ